MLKGLRDAGAALAAAIDQRVSLEAELESVEPTGILVVARKSAKPEGPARSLIIVLAGLLGLMAGIFSAFFAEFVSTVKARMREI
jgi:LPS O-antigen subunit length determinant protein (WzzB/FepE family)